MNKNHQIITMIIFMVILSAPLIRHTTKGDQVKNNENRKLVQRPVIPHDLNTLTSYFKQFENYLSDQFGFRLYFIKSANIIKHRLFNEVTSRNISFGKDGFVFLNSHSAQKPNLLIKIVCEAIHISRKQKHKTIITYRKLLNFYKKQNIDAKIAIIPLKSKIFPEKLPPPQSSWCLQRNPTWVDNNINKVGTGLYYPLAQINSWKKTFPVFLPSFFHWHGQLPYKIAKDLMQSNWEITADLVALSKKQLIESDLSKQFEGLHFFEDSFVYSYDGIKSCHQQNCIIGLRNLYKNSTSLKYTRKNKSTNRQLLILSDSFGIGIAQNFISGFDEVTLIETNHLKASERFAFYQKIHKLINPTHILHLYYSGRVFTQATNLKKFLDQIK